MGNPFAGDGEVRALCRALDWSATALGPPEEWPGVLRDTVRTALASPFPINLWCGPELVLIYNDAYRAVLGNKHPRALGAPGSVVWAEIWDRIAPMFEQIRAGGPPIYADDAPFVVDRRLGAAGETRPDDGPNAWFTFSLSPVRDAAGGIVAFLNIVSETTEWVLSERSREAARARAERAERRLLDVFTQAPAFLAVLRGPEHVFEYVNAAYYQLVGHRDIVGKPAAIALPEIRGQGFEALLDAVLETGEAYVGREAPILLSRRPDSEPERRYLDFVYYPITEADGTRTGVVAHGSDVTDHVVARQEAQRARGEAEQANEAKSQFLANMSHEIRTPINAIIGYTDLLEMGLAGPILPKQKEHLERVRLSGQHLLGLIDDILDLSKAEAGRVEVAHDPADAAEAVASALALVTPQAETRGVVIHSPEIGDAATRYYGDEDRVRQIVVNLLSNAVKFTPPGGEIHVDYGVTAEVDSDVVVGEEGPYAYIAIRDTGIGVAPAQLEEIFEPFAQVEGGHTRTRGGTGLGLTISRKLARLMGGDLTVESELGAGSTFTLWLPSRAVAPPLADTLLVEVADRVPQGVGTVGRALREGIHEILEVYVRRLREDEGIAAGSAHRQVDLEDHASSLLADVGQALISLEQQTVELVDLLRDGSEIQKLISRLHGVQRARLAWTEPMLQREFEILGEEVERLIRAKVDSPVDVEGSLSLVRLFVRHAERVSMRALRRSLSADPASPGSRPAEKAGGLPPTTFPDAGGDPSEGSR